MAYYTRHETTAMPHDVKKGKIIFLDDEPQTVEPLVAHLREEGFTNILLLTTIKTLSQLVEHRADLVYLDVAGVASELHPEDEGVSVLRHLRSHAPWTRVVVLSGSQFDAKRAPDLAKADLCVTKATLNLAGIVDITYDQLQQALAPENRNPRILEAMLGVIDNASLGHVARWRLQRAARKALKRRGDASFDWSSVVRTVLGLKGLTGNLRALAELLTDA